MPNPNQENKMLTLLCLVFYFRVDKSSRVHTVRKISSYLKLGFIKMHSLNLGKIRTEGHRFDLLDTLQIVKYFSILSLMQY